MIRTLLAAGAGALAIVTAAGAAQAAMTHVTVSGGVLDDTGTFSGWFDFDDANVDGPTAWDIAMTAGSTLPGDHFLSGGSGQTASDVSLLGTYRQFLFVHDLGPSLDVLELVLVDPGPGDALMVTTACLFACDINQQSEGTFDYRLTAAAGAVPEPGVWMLTLLGFGLSGMALRRRKPSAA